MALGGRAIPGWTWLMLAEGHPSCGGKAGRGEAECDQLVQEPRGAGTGLGEKQPGSSGGGRDDTPQGLGSSEEGDRDVASMGVAANPTLPFWAVFREVPGLCAQAPRQPLWDGLSNLHSAPWLGAPWAEATRLRHCRIGPQPSAPAGAE